MEKILEFQLNKSTSMSLHFPTINLSMAMDVRSAYTHLPGKVENCHQGKSAPWRKASTGKARWGQLHNQEPHYYATTVQANRKGGNSRIPPSSAVSLMLMDKNP
ncbi:hypothetical protein UY3_06330 [Chelonia mydas]|uniref:Uncharacterized protein n=1 Tax=Chelonia mydas TaxID=8469 RepID=M7BL93_CHEMY|nr:hypothetical protein UY3_06330 [Chelonia mydas]